ncbi:MAG: Rpn family recombination-promoting nuclease/putative transposase [Pseudomonadota bacterium]
MVTTMINITPKVDIVFKKLFGVEENKDLLISLINSIVSEEDQVEDIKLLNPYNLQDYPIEKLSILDIKAKSKSGERYNIEIQIRDAKNYSKRALYNWAGLYKEQLKRGDGYEELKKAIGIHILNFVSIPGTDKYHNKFNMKNQDNEAVYFKEIELHTIELKKFAENKTGQKLSEDEEVNLFLGKIKTSLDRWVAFLSRCDLLESDKFPSSLKNPELEKALSVLNVMSFDEKEREIYEGHLRWLRDEADAVLKAEEKGEKRGMEKGRAEGKAEGKAEGRADLINAMLKNGMTKEQVSTATGLSISEIEKL